MTKVVESRMPEPRRGHQHSEALGESFWVDRVAIFLREDQVMVGIGRHPRTPDFILAKAVGKQHFTSRLAKLDATRLATRGLGRGERQATVASFARRTRSRLAIQLHNLLSDHQRPGLYVDVAPAQPERLPTTESCTSEQFKIDPHSSAAAWSKKAPSSSADHGFTFGRDLLTTMAALAAFALPSPERTASASADRRTAWTRRTWLRQSLAR